MSFSITSTPNTESAFGTSSTADQQLQDVHISIGSSRMPTRERLYEGVTWESILPDPGCWDSLPDPGTPSPSRSHHHPRQSGCYPRSSCPMRQEREVGITIKPRKSFTSMGFILWLFLSIVRVNDVIPISFITTVPFKPTIPCPFSPIPCLRPLLPLCKATAWKGGGNGRNSGGTAEFATVKKRELNQDFTTQSGVVDSTLKGITQ